MTNPPAGIEQEWIDATVRALWDAWQQSDNVTPNAKGISWDTIAESRESNIAARSFYDAGISEAIAAIRVLAPLITARERERCAALADGYATTHHITRGGMSTVIERAELRGAESAAHTIGRAIRTPTQGETG